MSIQPPHLAKPSGITLVDHTRHVREQLDLYEQLDLDIEQRAREFVKEKYFKRTGDDLIPLVRQAIRWHDAGKKHPAWQSSCRADYTIWKRWHDNGRLGKEPPGINLQQSGIRHEMSSLKRMLTQEPEISRLVQVAVAAHHRKLGHRYQQRWLNDVNGEFAELWPLFVSLSYEVDYISELKEAVIRRYAYAGPRALLQLADHRASMKEDADIRKNGLELPGFVRFTYKFPHSEYRGPQKVISQLWDDPIALLRAPTGAGKTDAALIWAQHQIERKRADRLVIAMPTRFTANALAINTVKTLSSTGLYHSSAWYQRLKQSKDTDLKMRLRIDAEQDMARLLETPVTVTTIDHLCISLSGTREDHHAIFFNLANSCLVIDEADFYDEFTQSNLVLLLEVLRILNVPVLLMSATLPASSCQLYSVPKIYEDTEYQERIRCHVHQNEVPVVHPKDLTKLLEPIMQGKPAIIYANTVQRAQRYYKWLVDECEISSDEVVLYHSRFREPDKIMLEERLRLMLGEEAWKNERSGGAKVRGVAILTQIGELSVNISADYMLSELCPLDRFVQRVGRLARFPKQPGEQCYPGKVHLILPYKHMKDGTIKAYPAPYGSYVQGTGWVASPSLATSAQMLKRYNSYSAKMFEELVSELYEDLPVLDSHTRSNQDALRHMIGANWLLLPGNETSPEADETRTGTHQWKCRDIDPQITVLAGLNTFSQFASDETYVRSRQEWRRLVLEHGISCYKYEFERADKLGCLKKITVAIGEGQDDTEDVWLVRDAFYDSTLGLCFNDLDNDNDDE